VYPQPRGLKPGAQALMNQLSGSYWPSLGLTKRLQPTAYSAAPASLPLSAAAASMSVRRCAIHSITALGEPFTSAEFPADVKGVVALLGKSP
jgi:hypothetical protein